MHTVVFNGRLNLTKICCTCPLITGQCQIP